MSVISVPQLQQKQRPSGVELFRGIKCCVVCVLPAILWGERRTGKSGLTIQILFCFSNAVSPVMQKSAAAMVNKVLKWIFRDYFVSLLLLIVKLIILIAGTMLILLNFAPLRRLRS